MITDQLLCLQVQFVGEWFRSWSEMQRTDFLPTLVKELRPSHHMNGGLHQNIHNLSLSSRPPSIYNCQVMYFPPHVMYQRWTSFALHSISLSSEYVITIISYIMRHIIFFQKLYVNKPLLTHFVNINRVTKLGTFFLWLLLNSIY